MRRVAGALLAVVLVLPSLAVSAGAASTAGTAGYLPWSVPGPVNLWTGGVSCPAVGECMTVGSDLAPNAYYADQLQSSSWSSTSVPSPGETDRGSGFNFLPGVSCSSSSFCVAIGDTNQGSVASSQGPDTPIAEVWSGGAWSLATVPAVEFQGHSEGHLLGVSCPADGSCVAVGDAGIQDGFEGVAETLSGGSWSATVLPPNQQAQVGIQSLNLTGVSCTALGSCVASGYDVLYVDSPAHPMVASLSAGSWTETTLPLPSGWSTGQLDAISCAQAGLCVAVGSGVDLAGGNEALIETLANGSWTASTLPASAQSPQLTAISCAAGGVAQCAAVNGFDSKVRFLTGDAWTAQTLAVPAGQISWEIKGVSCPLANSCEVAGPVLGGSGEQLYGAEVSPTTANETRLPYQPAGDARLASVSCAAAFCMAAGVYQPTVGEIRPMAETWNGSVWTAGTIPIDGVLQSWAAAVSCPAPGWCEAIVDYNNANGSLHSLAETYSAGRWSAVVLPSPPAEDAADAGLEIAGISCPQIGRCVAVGSFGATPNTTRGVVEQLSGGSWRYWFPDQSSPVPAFLSSVSCPAVGWCAAVGGTVTGGGTGSQGVAITGWAHQWSGQLPPAPAGYQPGYYRSVSCPGVDACVATGLTGITGSILVSATLASGQWRDTSPGAYPVGLAGSFGDAIGCVSTSSCVTGGAFENGAALDVKVLGPSGWTTLTIGPPPLHDIADLVSVSCQPGGSCLLGGSEEPAVGNSTPLAATVKLDAPSKPTAVSVSAVPASPPSGQPERYTATIRPAPIAGNVTFVDQDSGQTICSARPISNGMATCATLAGNPGLHHILAAYSGSAVYAASAAAIPVTVQPPLCPTGTGHHATGTPWAVAAFATDLQGRLCAGYWVVTTSGGVTSIGAAPWLGDLTSRPLNAPIVGIAATPDRRGYYLVGADGGVFTFGDAHYYGSTGGLHLNRPVVAMAVTPRGDGYWLVAADGGVFSFGHAPFHGSMGDKPLARPIVGAAADPHTGGYWMVAADGGLFAFDAPFYGSAARTPLAAPVAGMTAQPDGKGYRLVATDGGVFDYGDAAYYGSLPAQHVQSPNVTTIAPSIDGRGYYLINATGQIWAFGDAPFEGNA